MNEAIRKATEALAFIDTVFGTHAVQIAYALLKGTPWFRGLTTDEAASLDENYVTLVGEKALVDAHIDRLNK